MDETEIKSIILGEDGSLCQNINKFIEKHTDTFSFPMLNSNDLRKELWSALFRYLQNKQLYAMHVPCLSAIRILSRDKTGLNEMICDNWMNILLYHSDLKEQPEEKSASPNYTVIIEGLKCLCNLVFNSSVASTISSQNGTLEAIMKRVLTYRDPEVPSDVKYFDMRLLFIITALCAEIRPKLQNELHGGTYLIEILDLIVKEAAVDQSNGAGIPSDKVILSESQGNLACEILKVLFNLYVNSNFTITNDEEEETHYLKLVIVLHDMLLASKSSNSRTDVHVQIISVLTALPSRYLKELYTPVTADQELSKEMEYEGYNMEAVYLLLTFLQNRLNNQQKAKGKNELLTPILTLLVMCASSSRIMRKYLRNQILPPLKDVHNRPEQGSTLRNHLCRLLSSPDTRARDLAAELIFVLCKENVGRMIKYTGYGNAAGWFANRSLLLGGRLEGSLKYSSESEDSDTEEYKEYKHGINHVMGCYEPPHPQPSMTEEQKEHEALILVELMQNLIDKKLIKPCIINEDGRPEPVDNVLQLQNALPRLQIRRNSESS